MVRRFSLPCAAAGAAFLSSGVIVCAQGVNSIQFLDGNVLQIQGSYGTGTNTAYEVIQIQPSLDYAWQFNWNPGTNVSGWSMLQTIANSDPNLGINSVYFGDPYDEHQVITFAYNGITSSAYYAALFYGSYNRADVSPANPQGTTFTGSGVGVDNLILTSDPSSIPAGDVALGNGSIIAWGEYTPDYSDQIPPALPEYVSIATGVTTTASTDSDLGSPPAPISLNGGTLKVLQSFNSPRPVTINADGGTIDVAPGKTFGLGGANLLAWGGTLNVTDSGTVNIAQTGPVAVGAGSTLNIAAGSTVIVNGSVDPFSDSFTGAANVAIANQGTFSVNVSSTIAGITGSGSLTVGNAAPATLQLAPTATTSSVSSLLIQLGSALDITSNTLDVNYASIIPASRLHGSLSASPVSTIQGYLADGQIFSSMSNSDYGVGYVDNGSTVQIAYTLLGDTNLDGTVNFTDLLSLAVNYGATGATWSMGDFNNNGTVNFTDLLELASNYGDSLSGAQTAQLPAAFAADWSLALSEVSATVPEPSSLTLLTTGIVCTLAKRKRRRLNPRA